MCIRTEIFARAIGAIKRSLRSRVTVRVHIMSSRADLATVHCRSWLGIPTDDVVCCVTAIGGGRLWIYDDTGRAVMDMRVINAIENERSRWLAAANR